MPSQKSKHCIRCGTEIPGDSAFCHNCGSQIPLSAAPTAAEARPAVPTGSRRKAALVGAAIAVVAALAAAAAVVLLVDGSGNGGGGGGGLTPVELRYAGSICAEGSLGWRALDATNNIVYALTEREAADLRDQTTLIAMDGDSRQIIRSAPLSGGFDIAINEGKHRLYIADHDNDRLIVLNVDPTGTDYLETIAQVDLVEPAIVAINEEADKIYVATVGGASQLTEIDGRTHEVSSVLDLGQYISSIYSVATDAANNLVYVSGYEGDFDAFVVLEIDARTNAVIDEVASTSEQDTSFTNFTDLVVDATSSDVMILRGLGVETGDGAITVDRGDVLVVEGATGRSHKLLQFEGAPNAFALDSTRGSLYLLFNTRLDVVDASTGAILGSIELQGQIFPEWVLPNPDSNRIYVGVSEPLAESDSILILEERRLSGTTTGTRAVASAGCEAQTSDEASRGEPEPTIVITLSTPTHALTPTPTPFPSPTPDPDVCGVNPDPAPPSLLQVQEPQPGERVENPFHVRGWGSEIGLDQSGVIVALVDVNGEPIQDKDVPPESRAGRIVPAGLTVTDATAPFTTDILIQGLSDETPFCVWVFLQTTEDGIPMGVVQVPVVVVP